MTKSNAPFSDAEIKRIVELHDLDDIGFAEISRRLERDRGSVRRIYNLNCKKPPYHLSESPYPIYDQPIEDEGNALILPDPEIPFHDAEFINRCIDLALKWGITHLIVPGDLVHFASMSGWAPAWQSDETGDISEHAEQVLLGIANAMPPKYRRMVVDTLVDLNPTAGDSISEELAETRKQLGYLSSAFKTATLDMGNHEGRLLATMDNPLSVDDLKKLLSIGSWKASCYYYSFLTSNGERFKLTHPKPYSDRAPAQLAAIDHCHIMMGHSHKIIQMWDPSGKYYAWHIGCCVDEKRLAYVGQRDRSVQPSPHKLGAVIIFDGVPYMLHDRSPWKRLMTL